VQRSKRAQPGVGEAIRMLRVEQRRTQGELAREAGITVAHLSKIERGYINPTWGSVSAIAAALGTTVASVAVIAEVHTPPEADPEECGR
jgi:transcriptional regulator with XRE-family HTH domain